MAKGLSFIWESANKIEHLTPGDCVSVDQYISGLPGRLPHTAGKENKSKWYNGGTIFVDHASGYAFLRHQVALTAGETIHSKYAFEQKARSCGNVIPAYRADNVPFKSQAFMDDLKLNKQTITFSGVGAHHQNGISEWCIQMITRSAHLMLLHSVIM